MDVFNLKGKVAIIIGASRGLGKGMAIALASAGADVVVTSRSQIDLQQVASEITMNTNARVLPISYDVSDVDKSQELVERVVEKFGKIDILVNAAGMNIRKPILEVTEEDWDTLMDVQLKGVFFTCQAVGKEMLKQGKGKIINTASLTSVIGIPNISVYGAAKGAIVQMTKAMAVEWAKNNINVNCIGPGYYKTEMTKAVFEDELRLQELLRRIPMGRTGLTQDLAGTIVFLASDASDYITGQTIYVDGGWLAG